MEILSLAEVVSFGEPEKVLRLKFCRTNFSATSAPDAW
jgi:hypothetical protein